MRASPDDSDEWRLDERRKETRHTLILRVGLLEQAGKSSLCLVRNVSSTGTQLKIYTPAVVDVAASIRVADEPAVTGRIVWVDGHVAGMSFSEELNSATLLRVQQKLGSNRRRSMPRVNVNASATLRTGGRTSRAVVRDISSSGARVRTNAPLKAGDRAIITLADMPSLSAYVRWTDGEESGLVFATPIPMQIIALWIQGRALLSA